MFGWYDVLTQLRKENSQMKKYEEAIIEIEKFEIMDVITDSQGDIDMGDTGDNGTPIG